MSTLEELRAKRAAYLAIPIYLVYSRRTDKFLMKLRISHEEAREHAEMYPKMKYVHAPEQENNQRP